MPTEQAAGCRVAGAARVATPAIAAMAFAMFLLPCDSRAQSPAVVIDGINFAKSITPNSSRQIVNPAGVNAAAWSGATSTPTAVPGSMGVFSTPTVTPNAYNAAKAMGLSAYGTQAALNCANYNPATGTPMQTQTCVAVNFLTNRCLSPTTQQSSTMAANGASSMASGDCTGTYGQSQARFGFAEQLATTDSVFTVVNALPVTAAASTTPSCTLQPVVTAPAQFAQQTCTKDDVGSLFACSQTLTPSVVTVSIPAPPSTTCAAATDGTSGILRTGTVGNYTGPYCYYIAVDDCPGTSCADLVGTQGFLGGGTTTTHHQGECEATTRCDTLPDPNCPTNTVPSGSSCVSRTLEKTFADNCSTFTTSSGTPLPHP